MPQEEKSFSELMIVHSDRAKGSLP